MSALLLLALWPGGVAGIAIWTIIVCAVVAIAITAAKAMGVAIPDWVVKVMWIVVIAVVCITAIKILLSAV